MGRVTYMSLHASAATAVLVATSSRSVTAYIRGLHCGVLSLSSTIVAATVAVALRGVEPRSVTTTVKLRKE